MEIINDKYRPRGNPDNLRLLNKFEEKVFLVKSFPGISGEIIDFLVDRGYKGIVLEGTGLGHFPEYTLDSIRRAIESGVVVVMTSQCLWGRVNMNVYSTGRKLLSIGVIPGDDMLPEVALVKLMWALGQTRDLDKVKAIMLTNIANEIGARSLVSNYLKWGL